MKAKIGFIAMVALLLVAETSFAQWCGGGGRPRGAGSGQAGGAGQWGGGGRGYGMVGAGGMMGWMFNGTMNQGYLDILAPITTPDEATSAVQAFLTAANSNLQISGLWEYKTAYKAELADANGQKAFDVLVDKFTGAVMPEMGFSMMMNASWGRALQKTPRFGRSPRISPEQATSIAQGFVDKNSLGYNLQEPEAYPGYYKFHTTDSTDGFGMDIMVSGYSGGVWMNTLLGLPINRF